jgi:regulator of RNase E activity RraA
VVELSHQSALDMLQPGDVVVIDAGGNPDLGGIIGDNLAFFIWKRTGTGFVIDGAIRDVEGIAPFDMPGYYRMAVPGASASHMTTGINIPVRIGKATVLPGDLVFGDREGVNFIPPQAVQRMIDAAKATHAHHDWAKSKFETNQYKTTDVYGSGSLHDPALKKEHDDYVQQQVSKQK